MNVRKKVRSTSHQLKHLTDFMVIDPMFAAGEYRDPLGGSKLEQRWERLRQELAERGPDKTVEQWKQTWRDLKRKARNENARALSARNPTDNADEVPEVSEISQKILSTIAHPSITGSGPMESGIGRAATWRDKKRRAREEGAKINTKRRETGNFPQVPNITAQSSMILGVIGHASATELEAEPETGIGQGEASADENTAPSSFQKPRSKRSHFQKVRSRCVALVVKHGRPAELLDDTAFKDILNLIPMTRQERNQLTSEAIKEFIENTDAAEVKSGEDFQDDQDDDDDYKADDDDMDMESERERHKRKVKNERAECVCPSRDTGTHEPGCAAIAQDTYWQYFHVSIDEAKCKLCSGVIKWTSMSDLKVHMTVTHPNVEFKDDDEEFTTDRGRKDSEGGGSIPDHTMEEVYLEEDLFQIPSRPAPSTAKKRKYPPNTVVTLKDSETICLERFKSLDRFGLYIASLMKLLPPEKSLKYQEQIVQRLIREQAAAG